MALFLTALLGVGVSLAAPIDLPPSDVRLDLGGKTEVVRGWEWPGWNGYCLSISNGTLSVTGRMHPRHGSTDILRGGVLRFEDGSSYMPGAGDAQSRTTRVWAGGTLDLSHGALNPFNSRCPHPS